MLISPAYRMQVGVGNQPCAVTLEVRYECAS